MTGTLGALECKSLRSSAASQTARSRSLGTGTEGRWSSWGPMRGPQRPLSAVKVRRSAEPARGERGARGGERAARARGGRAHRLRRHGAPRAGQTAAWQLLEPNSEAGLCVRLPLLASARRPCAGRAVSLGTVGGTRAGESALGERARCAGKQGGPVR